MKRLGEIGTLVINGPLLDCFATGGEMRGNGVMKTACFAETEKLISTVPMVKVGHLIS
jgi:hypothetical protein